MTMRIGEVDLEGGKSLHVGASLGGVELSAWRDPEAGAAVGILVPTRARALAALLLVAADEAERMRTRRDPEVHRSPYE